MNAKEPEPALGPVLASWRVPVAPSPSMMDSGVARSIPKSSYYLLQPWDHCCLVYLADVRRCSCWTCLEDSLRLRCLELRADQNAGSRQRLQRVAVAAVVVAAAAAAVAVVAAVPAVVVAADAVVTDSRNENLRVSLHAVSSPHTAAGRRGRRRSPCAISAARLSFQEVRNGQDVEGLDFSLPIVR
jgi:hypothetical protein